MIQKTQSSKEIMLPHSEAKVEMYERYLRLYLTILCRVSYIKEINIYDVFCGKGIYDNGKNGSSIRAFNVIKEVMTSWNSNTKITLHLNDINEENINTAKAYIENNGSDKSKDFNIEYSTKDACELLNNLSDELLTTNKDNRNFIFIDPYGYKEVKKDVIERLMSNGKTEILLFIPINFMARFRKAAVENATIAGYKPLNDFLMSFFPDDHPMNGYEDISDMDFIKYVKDALSFKERFFCSSFYIERSRNNYFSLFHITSNFTGYKKMIEAKWSLSAGGEGFDQQQYIMPSMFAEEDRKNIIRTELIKYLSRQRTNKELNYFIFKLEFLPKHLTDVLKEMLAENLIKIEQIPRTKKIKKGYFYINDENNRITIKLNQ